MKLAIILTILLSSHLLYAQVHTSGGPTREHPDDQKSCDALIVLAKEKENEILKDSRSNTSQITFFKFIEDQVVKMRTSSVSTQIQVGATMRERCDCAYINDESLRVLLSYYQEIKKIPNLCSDERVKLIPSIEEIIHYNEHQ